MTSLENLRIAGEFRDIWKALDDLGRRQHAAVMTGTVAAIDGNLVRLELAPSGPSGRPFLSPWVQLQDAAGSTASHLPVAIGDPMRLLSPNGELGPASLAIRDSHTDAAPNPSADPQTLVIEHAGCRLVMAEGLCELSQGDAVIRISGGNTEILSGEHRHNGTNIGDTHVHTGVTPGGGLSGTPL